MLEKRKIIVEKRIMKFSQYSTIEMYQLECRKEKEGKEMRRKDKKRKQKKREKKKKQKKR